MWLVVFVWAAIIFYFSAQPSLSTHWGVWDFLLRKAAHMIEFGVLTLLIWRAVRQHGVSDSRSLPASAFLALLYAFSDEFHQRYVQGRMGTVRDVAIDLAGIIIVLLAAILLGRNRARRRSSEK